MSEKTKMPTLPESPNLSDPEKPVPMHDETKIETGVLTKHDFTHHDPDWTGDDVDFSGVDEAATLRKMDLRLLPLLTLLYLLAFIDRNNVGNAKIEGLTEDLHMTGPQYNWCLTAFFLSYCAFEVPSNLMLKRLRPSFWLPTIMVAWGIVMTLMGIVQNYHGLLAARIFLGVAEAGLYPGVAFYITCWYCRHEAQLRQALFYSGASMAGAFSGLLAFAIAKMDGVGGLEGWRWIFLLEGMATVVIAFASYWLLYDFPDTASFLTIEERAWVIHRLKYQGSQDSSQKVAEQEHFQWRHVKEAFTDWQVLVALWMYFGIVCPLYGIGLFLPTIILELGFSAAKAQLLTVPIYCTAAIVTIAVAYYADKYSTRIGRAPFVFIPMCFILIGFIIAIAASANGSVPGVVYLGVFIATVGIYPSFPGNICWISNNLAGTYKRTAGMGVHIGAGNLAGAMASNFYRSADSPKFLLGHGLEIGFVTAGLIAVVVLRVNYARINAKREREGNSHNYSLAELSDMGDKAPTFRYML